MRQKVTITWRRQRSLYFDGQLGRSGHAPLGQQAGMNHRELALDVEQRQTTQPRDQFISIFGRKDCLQRIFAGGLAEIL
jgi:hypothetical protein